MLEVAMRSDEMNVRWPGSRRLVPVALIVFFLSLGATLTLFGKTGERIEVGVSGVGFADRLPPPQFTPFFKREALSKYVVSMGTTNFRTQVILYLISILVAISSCWLLIEVSWSSVLRSARTLAAISSVALVTGACELAADGLLLSLSESPATWSTSVLRSAGILAAARLLLLCVCVSLVVLGLAAWIVRRLGSGSLGAF